MTPNPNRSYLSHPDAGMCAAAALQVYGAVPGANGISDIELNNTGIGAGQRPQ